MKKFIQEFKEFALKGNVIDMAVGVVIGGAFKGIVDSLVADIINPIIGLFANQDLSKYSITIGDVSILYGSFVSAVINFLLMALVIFCIVKGINKAKNFRKTEEEEAAPAVKMCPYCRSEIAIEATRCPHCTSQLEA